ncbi:LPS export ABC transporter permease LptF [Qingshengfaniella alkalisoli]|uniref:LPS export ABC transporter permease LptF n=1 Tax=Qingshengfaniella alkalisoli TaxID=2599296 RepID=UPI00143D1A80|nr:LPS export ABC transporter permease LptF [Qingshengfaniella alkalisoli]
MGRIDRYILSQLVFAFGFFSLILVGIYWVNQAVLMLTQYISEGQSGIFVFELMLLSLPSLMLLVLPISAFVATVYVTNKLYSDSELVVVQATGFSVFRLARPFATFSLLIVVLIIVLAHLLVPSTVRRLDSREAELAQALSARILVPGSFESPTSGVTVYVRDITPEGTIEDLLMSDIRDPDRQTTYMADQALLVRDAESTNLVMFQGMAQTLEPNGERLSITRFDDFTVAIDSLIQQSTSDRVNPQGLSTLQLLTPDAELAQRTRRSADYLQREAHLRVTQALLAGGAAFLGYAALMIGGFSRFGLWKQIAAAVFLVVIVKLIDNSSIDAASRDPALWPLVYLSSLLAVVICLALLFIANSNLPARLRRRSAG